MMKEKEAVPLAIDPYLFGDKDEIQRKWDNRVERADKAHPIDSKEPVKCPGENTIERRNDSMENGVNVDEKIWAQIEAISMGEFDIIDVS